MGSWLMVNPTQQNNYCALQLIACVKHEQTSESFDPTQQGSVVWVHCLCCRLKWFKIQGNAIGGGVPSNWSVMGNLTRLNLASNKLQGISAHRGSLKCIERRAACFTG